MRTLFERLTYKERGNYTTVQELEGDLFRELCSPGVYIFSTAKEVLYVGSSGRMLNRASNPRHGSAIIAAKEATSVIFLPCASVKLALTQERTMIEELKPKYNIAGNVRELGPVSELEQVTA